MYVYMSDIGVLCDICMPDMCVLLFTAGVEPAKPPSREVTPRK